MDKKEIQAIFSLKDKFSPQLKSIQTKVKVFAQDIARNWTNIHFAIKDTAAVLRNIAKTMKAIGIDAAQQMEAYKVQLMSVLGSQEKTARMLEYMKSFTATTPFNIENVVEAGIALENVGLKAKENLEIIGNVAGAFGRDITEVARGVQSMQAEVLRRYGINVRREADRATFVWTDQWGKIQEKTIEGSYQVQQKTLLAIWNERYKGGMERFQTTYQGMLSNLEDAMFLFKVQIGESGFLDAVKGEMERLLKIVEDLRESGKLEDIALSISNAMITAINWTKKFIFFLARVVAGWKMIIEAVKLSHAVVEQFLWKMQGAIEIAVANINNLVVEGLSKLGVLGRAAARRLNLEDIDIEAVRKRVDEQVSAWKEYGDKAADEILKIEDELETLKTLLGDDIPLRTKEGLAKIKQELKDAKQEVNNLTSAVNENKDAWKENMKTAVEHFQNWSKDAKDMAKHTAEAMTSAMDGFASGTAKALRETLEEGKDFADSMKEMFKDLMWDLAEDIMRSGIRNLLAQIFNFGGQTGSSGGGGIGNIFTSFLSSLFGGSNLFGHEGGRVTFKGIRRYHQGGLPGLRYDEVPAILQTGERVLNRREAGEYEHSQRAVNINYYINAIDSQSFNDYVRRNPDAILGVVDSNIRKDKMLRNTIKRYT